MVELSSSYLAEIARLIGGISAFLGGFAATFLASLIAGKFESRYATRTMASAAIAAVMFIVAVIASTMLVITLHPDVPDMVAKSSSVTMGRAVSFISFFIGIYSLLFSLGASGWIHSRKLGWITMISSLLGVVLVSMAISGF